MRRLQTLWVFLLLAPFVLKAQESSSVLKPVTPEPQISQDLFSLPESDLNHHFTVALHDNGFLIIEFSRLSDWRDTAAFRTVVRSAASVAGRMQDSLGNPRASYRLDMQLPLKNTPVTARVKAHTENADLVVLSEQDEAPLKIGMDTIRILKTLGDVVVDGKKQKVKIQYTFLLKNMMQIRDLADDDEWMDNTASVLDSVVMVYRRRWHHQDLWYHNLYVSYRPQESEYQKQLVINQRQNLDEEKGVGKALEYSGGLGISLVRNTLEPNVEVGLSYILDHSKDGDFFARFSEYGFFMFGRQPDNSVKAYSVVFLNAEFGSSSTGGKNFVLPYSMMSIGFGVKIGQKYNPESFQRDWYRLFFRYGITKSITLTPEFYYTPKKKEQDWFGMSMNLRLF